MNKYSSQPASKKLLLKHSPPLVETACSRDLLPLIAKKRLRRRWLRGAAIVPAKEFLLNLYRDLMQPSLGSICPVLMVPDVCFKLPYSVFGGAKLSRQLVSHFDGLLVICLSITRRPVEQPQDCLACPVKWVARFRPDVRCKEAFSSLIVSALIIVPQLIVALMASWAGRRANTWGRRPLLLVGFAALPIRALVFAWTTSPMVLIAAQILDGVSGTMLGVLTALIVSDLTRGTGRFSLALGFVGTMSGIGASLSTTLTGLVAGSFGRAAGFLSIAAVALVALLLLWLRMPETNPSSRNDARILP